MDAHDPINFEGCGAFIQILKAVIGWFCAITEKTWFLELGQRRFYTTALDLGESGSTGKNDVQLLENWS